MRRMRRGEGDVHEVVNLGVKSLPCFPPPCPQQRLFAKASRGVEKGLGEGGVQAGWWLVAISLAQKQEKALPKDTQWLISPRAGRGWIKNEQPGMFHHKNLLRVPFL